MFAKIEKQRGPSEENNPAVNVVIECVRPDCGKGNARLVQLHSSKWPPPRWVRAQRSRLRTHLPRDRGVVWGGGQEIEEISDSSLPAAGSIGCRLEKQCKASEQ